MTRNREQGKTEAPAVKAEVEKDLIILDSSHDESKTSNTSCNGGGMLVGLSKSPQLHARSLLLKTPTANHKSTGLVSNLVYTYIFLMMIYVHVSVYISISYFMSNVIVCV